MAKSKTRVIKVYVDTKNIKGLKTLQRELEKVSKTSKSTAKSLSLMSGSFTGFLGIISGRELARMADEIQLTENRLKVFTGSVEGGAEALKQLQLGAKFTKSSIAGLGTVYNRVALSTQELGLSQEQILATTVALQQSFRVSGSTLAEATASSIQLSQGLSQGELRGQELRSVLEANTILAGAFAKELDATRGQLIKMAEQGKITTDVVLRTLAKLLPTLNEQAEELGITFEQAAVIGLDAFKVKLNDLNKAFKVSTKFAEGIEFLANNMESLFKIVGAVVATGIIGKLAIQLKLAFVAVSPLSVAIVAAATAVGFLSEHLAKIDVTDVSSQVFVLEGNINSLKLKIAGMKVAAKAGFNYKAEIADAQAEIDALKVSIHQLTTAKITENATTSKGFDIMSEYRKMLEKTAKTLTTFKSTAKLKGVALFNKQLKDGTLSLEKYDEKIKANKLDQLNTKFKKGTVDIHTYRKELIKLGETYEGITKTSLNKVRIQSNLDDLQKSFMDTTAGINNTINNSFKNLENAVVTYVTTGKFRLKDFFNGILEDITRVIVRATIMNSVLSGLKWAGSYSGGVGGGSPEGTTAITTNKGNFMAKGGAFQGGNIIPFARGGVVNGPSLFNMTGNKTGVMGEEGPEAIMPLQRDSKGRLGISGSGTVVNVINQSSNSETQTKETSGPDGSKQIEIMVVDKVARAFSSGKLDRTMRENYGVARRGR